MSGDIGLWGAGAGGWGVGGRIKMRKLTQSVSRIIKFYLALVQTTGRMAVGYRILRERLLIKMCRQGGFAV